MTTSRPATGPRRRTAAALVATAIGMGALTGCGSSAGPEAGEVTTEDLQRLEDDLAALEDRIGVLEEARADAPTDGSTGGSTDASTDGSTGGEEPTGGGVVLEDQAGVFDDAQSLVGEGVTVSAAVSEVITRADVGSAFRIGGADGEPITVVMATPPDRLAVDDVVRVSGTVTEIQRDSFERDFGIAADALFDDADAFFASYEGEAAIAADRTEVLQEPSDN